MPFRDFLRPLVPAAAAVAFGWALLAVPAATAGGLQDDLVYADSFGNLVIHSTAGYKRILVGKGHLTDEYAARETKRDPKMVYLEEDRGKLYLRHKRKCRRYGVLLHGRSYMYGLPDGVVPVPIGRCR